MRYFKKFDPTNQVWTGAGFPVPFLNPVDNGEWGLLATEDSYIIKELLKCIREERGGVAEINANEYEDLKKKENQIMKPIWRESISRSKLAKIIAHVQEKHAAAVNHVWPDIFKNFKEGQVLSRPVATSTFRPAARTVLFK